MTAAADRAGSELFERATAVRTAVVGEEYVRRSLDSRTEFTAPLQQLVTESVWGRVWARDGLSHRDRSLVTVSVLATLGRLDELDLHLAGALRNGVTPIELREMIMQVAMYAGVPAALATNRVALDVLGRHGIDPDRLEAASP